MGTNGAPVTPVIPVIDGQEKMAEREVKTGDKSKVEKVTTTLQDGESVAIISTDALKLISLAFNLQEDYDNASMYQRDALASAALLHLKAEVSRAVAQWDNLVTKMSKTTRFRNRYTREQLDKFLRTQPKCAAYWKRAQKAAAIKTTL